ncbi:hypothetical protein NC652_006542 [Populus alba x Populus x berolinensis]|uniref:Uncharacterized protein n=1 Tax=Populus alba x Populus x berolinensis TaxID=444605 RepID=A0AAD6RER1_9ROSI|nr:hypothetical protein NC652_006542 [Populus alba x Populus x berolinensis]KAJ7007436.1 hypothetical protein NC653_006464 [Populus alba x Populus x berolinensis]
MTLTYQQRSTVQICANLFLSVPCKMSLYLGHFRCSNPGFVINCSMS